MLVLLFGTYSMITATFLSVIALIALGTSHAENVVKAILLAAILFIYCLGNVAFLSNIIQFGTDQLRDEPTRCSVRFIYMYFWMDSLSCLICKTAYWPGSEIDSILNIHMETYDKGGFLSIITLLSLSVVMASALLLIVLVNQLQLFQRETKLGNPYKLVYNVVKFAILHRKPLKRGAFTFCDNIRPSRLDFGKQRYGGPFTTEQVEDVRVMLNILKILFFLRSSFLIRSYCFCLIF